MTKPCIANHPLMPLGSSERLMGVIPLLLLVASLCCFNGVRAQQGDALKWEDSRLYTSISKASAAREQGTPIYRLDLSKQKLKALPVEILNWTELREVVLDRNRITTLGSELKAFVFLERFSANSNRIRRFPQAFIEMDQLVELQLGDNLIDSIPLNIDEMKSLETLGLWANIIEYFPASLSDLEKLRSLDLLHNDMVLEEQEALRDWLSEDVQLILSAPCRCEFDE